MTAVARALPPRRRLLPALQAGLLAVAVAFAAAAPAQAGPMTLYVSNVNSNTVMAFTPGGVGSLFATTAINNAYGLAIDSAGSLYVSSPNYANGNGGIEKFTPAGVGTSFATLRYPAGLAFSSDGTLFVTGGGSPPYTDKITPAGVVSTFAIGLRNPQGIAIDSTGNIFVSDYGTNAIYKYTPAGARTTFKTGLNQPDSGLAFDSAGNLFFSSHGNNTISKITAAGVLSVFATGLNNPTGLAFDGVGNLFVANNGNNTILEFTPAGVGSVFASTGLNGPLGLVFGPADVPEPASLAILAIGLAGFAAARRRKPQAR